MWLAKILKTVGKLILKVLLLPVILLVVLLSVFVKILMHIGNFAAGLFILFLFGCTVWTIVHGLWTQTGLLLGIGVVSVGAVAAAGLLEAALDGATSALGGLLAR